MPARLNLFRRERWHETPKGFQGVRAQHREMLGKMQGGLIEFDRHEAKFGIDQDAQHLNFLRPNQDDPFPGFRLILWLGEFLDFLGKAKGLFPGGRLVEAAGKPADLKGPIGGKLPGGTARMLGQGEEVGPIEPLQGSVESFHQGEDTPLAFGVRDAPLGQGVLGQRCEVPGIIPAPDQGLLLKVVEKLGQDRSGNRKSALEILEGRGVFFQGEGLEQKAGEGIEGPGGVLMNERLDAMEVEGADPPASRLPGGELIGPGSQAGARREHWIGAACHLPGPEPFGAESLPNVAGRPLV